MKYYILSLIISLFINKVSFSQIKSNKFIPQQFKSIEENFFVFFEIFKNDSVFQKSRINDKISLYEYDEYDNIIKTEYSKQDFSYMDFSQDSIAYKNEDSKYKIEIKISEDSTYYQMVGVDNGIFMYYVFKSQDGKWNLTSIHNYSN